jgi:hypothetical protein
MRIVEAVSPAATSTAPRVVATFTCQSSATTGVSCRNSDTGHGFSISVQTYRVF